MFISKTIFLTKIAFFEGGVPLKWKVKFGAEQAELIKAVKVDEADSKKLTGRQLFEKDRSLYDSDIKFISGEGMI